MKRSRDESRTFTGFRFLVASASFVIVVAGLKAAGSILIPFLFAMFLSMIISGPVKWFERKGVPVWLAYPIMVSVVVGGAFGVGGLLVVSFNEFVRAVPQYLVELRASFERLIVLLHTYGIEMSVEDVLASIDPAALVQVSQQALGGVVGIASKLVVVMVFLAFILMESTLLRKKFTRALPRRADLKRFEGVIIDVQNYLVIKTITSALTGISVGLWVWGMGIEFPLLWGTLSFLLNYIPMVGSTVASIPPILLCVVGYGWGAGTTLAIGYVVINVGISNFLEPIFLGRHLDISPLVVFMALVFWGWVWGGAGMLLSIPLAMVIKIFLEHTEDFQWVGEMMSAKVTVQPVSKNRAKRVVPQQ